MLGMGAPGKKEKVSKNKLVQADIFKTLDSLHGAIKTIGDAHYGKSWVAWSPQITTKVTEDIQNFGEYERSWVPSNSAYLEPSVYDSFHAPQHNKFLDGGRLKAFANYTSVLDGTYNITNGTVPLDTGIWAYDFTNVPEDSKFQSNFCDGSKVHTSIDIDPEYTFVPYDYFYWYDRSRRPLVKDGEVFDIDYKDVDWPFLVDTTGYRVYEGTDKSSQDYYMYNHTRLPKTTPVTETPVATGLPSDYRIEQLLCNDVTNTGEFPASGISNTRLVGDFLDLIVPDHGVDCIVFTKFKTSQVFYPKGDEAGSPNVDLSISLLAESYRAAVGISGVDTTNSDIPATDQDTTFYAKPAVPPLEVVLPQQSTRHRYGPWFTTHNFIYAGKVELIEDDSLVPENYISPIYGVLSSSDPNAPAFSGELSGFKGMNSAASGIANAIDGYGQFAAEDGNITVPGGPLVKRIGDALLGGPYITELSVKVGAQGIETSYSFNSATKKAGKTNSDIVKKLRDYSTKVTRNRN